ncbi:MAG: hypothetical protein ACFBSG_11680 [Leptolyngbyaceae cyanobacterium]
MLLLVAGEIAPDITSAAQPHRRHQSRSRRLISVLANSAPASAHYASVVDFTATH